MWDQFTIDRCIWFYRNPSLCNGEYPVLTSIILIVLLILLIGAIPGAWPHSKDWGRGPIGLLTLVLVVVLIIMLLGGL